MQWWEPDTVNRVSLTLRGQRYEALLDQALDIAIGLEFDGPQPSLFGAPTASARAVADKDFVGDTRAGGSCNCEEYRLVPHCVGTHTECVGHITAQRVSIHQSLGDSLMTALLVSVSPVDAAGCDETSDPPPRDGDSLITAAALSAANGQTEGIDALIIRTLPNEDSKKSCDYNAQIAPFLTLEAMDWINTQNIDHLLVDTPSLDRGDDLGRLATHRAFWGLAPGESDASSARHPARTVTELIYVPDSIVDGEYLLNLQVAPFVTDAAPSRPRLFPLVEA